MFIGLLSGRKNSGLTGVIFLPPGKVSSVNGVRGSYLSLRLPGILIEGCAAEKFSVY